MPLTKEQKDAIKNHFSDVPVKMSIFKQLVDADFPDEEKKTCLLAIIDKIETEVTEIKGVIETLPD